MSGQTTILESYRPRCRAADGQGWRCLARVVWDDAANRPVSTRCETHGGLADAAFLRRQSPVAVDRPRDQRPRARVGDGLASVLNALRTKRLDQSFAILSALVVALVLLMATAGPALAEFESGVADYERGAYREALTAFEAAAEAGDERALPYLEWTRQRLDGESGPAMSAPLVTDAGPVSGDRASRSDSGQGRAGADLSELFGGSANSALNAPRHSDVVTPRRESAWSTVFHLPGDATVVGLQHVAHFFDAHDFSQELRVISRSSDRITLSVLAGLWWLAIVRIGVGIGIAIGRLTKAATTRTETRRYG